MASATSNSFDLFYSEISSPIKGGTAAFYDLIETFIRLSLQREKVYTVGNRPGIPDRHLLILQLK